MADRTPCRSKMASHEVKSKSDSAGTEASTLPLPGRPREIGEELAS